jgi:hypothetical protein
MPALSSLVASEILKKRSDGTEEFDAHFCQCGGKCLSQGDCDVVERNRGTIYWGVDTFPALR